MARNQPRSFSRKLRAFGIIPTRLNGKKIYSVFTNQLSSIRSMMECHVLYKTLRREH